jgi:hypothetical protein
MDVIYARLQVASTRRSDFPEIYRHAISALCDFGSFVLVSEEYCAWRIEKPIWR